MRKLGIGLIGTGFMGKSHAMAWRAAASFSGEIQPVLVSVADINGEAAENAASQFGFQRWATRWQDLIEDPEIDVISITSPNRFHAEQSLAAIAAGKHVHCEKPLAPNGEIAEQMYRAAEKAGVITQVGFNYIKNPLLKRAKQMIADGELGDITGFRGIHAEDFMTSPQVPWSWRLDPSGGAGAVADLGSHILGMARFMLGPISEIFADLDTVVKARPESAGATQLKAVEVDDIARLTVKFARGCAGQIEANWVASGHKMQLGFEITGTRGSLIFNQERFNELQWYQAGDREDLNGFRTIVAGPEHAPYNLFCPAAGHQIGFNDLKTIEMLEFIQSIASGKAAGPDFKEAYEIQRLVDAALVSSRERSWIRL
ncbi:Gfo/Idh/MocA family protein [Candidatus Pantoea multigeneris]|uniref:Gfo/Idh/MocA family oxidoreductase n=1 Tax=Candidatus Pantoea multigeneris TaxID=2608357 RepID=A0ABX0RJP2_9GAMM|nr:Gfo/Idh/MocA family oxidoreductase [Pantoea multigeneris]NIF23844.1 Gfo/Idh/MocA family oxidoreductase [Pantoea multigeneris]